MPLLVLLGIIVFIIALAIFKVNKAQSDKFIETAKKAESADYEDDKENKNI